VATVIWHPPRSTFVCASLRLKKTLRYSNGLQKRERERERDRVLLNWLIKKGQRSSSPPPSFPLSVSAFVDADKGVSLCLPWDQMHPGRGQDADPWRSSWSSRCGASTPRGGTALHIGSEVGRLASGEPVGRLARFPLLKGRAAPRDGSLQRVDLPCHGPRWLIQFNLF